MFSFFFSQQNKQLCLFPILRASRNEKKICIMKSLKLSRKIDLFHLASTRLTSSSRCPPLGWPPRSRTRSGANGGGRSGGGPRRTPSGRPWKKKADTSFEYIFSHIPGVFTEIAKILLVWNSLEQAWFKIPLWEEKTVFPLPQVTQ